MAREQPGHLLQPSALVSEAFLRLASGDPVEWKDRAHFFAHSTRIMRNILVDFARRRALAADLEWVDAPELAAPPAEFLDVDAALTELTALDERHGRIVELRYYGGLSVMEVAEALGVSEATVNREWRVARGGYFAG